MSMKVTWIGHACILIETPQGNLITDPWLVDPCLYQVVVHASRPSMTVTDLPPIDVICITHPHYDHFDPRTLTQLSKSALVIIPVSPIRRLKEKLENLGFRNVQPLKYWTSYQAIDLEITVTPSHGIPEEGGFLISDGESTLYHAADCLFGPVGPKLQKYNIDLAFLPFSGWDISGALGIEVEKQWKPSGPYEAQNAIGTGARYVVPASCDQFWAPMALQWLNQRTHPGTVDEYIKAVDEYRSQHPEVETEVVPLNPGSSWTKAKGFTIVPERQEPIPIYAPKEPAPVSMDKVMAGAELFLARRRPQVFQAWHHHVLGVLVLLLRPYTFHLTDLGRYVRMHLISPKGFYPVEIPVEKAERTPLIHIRSQDACNLFSGKSDIEMLVMASRIKLTNHKSDFDLICAYALEYLFTKEDYSDVLQEINLSEQYSNN